MMADQQGAGAARLVFLEVEVEAVQQLHAGDVVLAHVVQLLQLLIFFFLPNPTHMSNMSQLEHSTTSHSH